MRALKRAVAIAILLLVTACMGVYAFIKIRYHHTDIQQAFNEAASRGDVVALEKYRQQGANIEEGYEGDIADSCYPAIIRAAKDGRVEAVRWLLEHGAKANVVYDERLTPLDLAEFVAYNPGEIGERGAKCVALLKAHEAKRYEPLHEDKRALR